MLVAASPAPQGHIAFVSGSDQQTRRVCLLDLETGAVTPLGPGRLDGAPVWSPDGQWLAFPTRADGDGMGIRLVNPDTREEVVIPHARRWNSMPRWSPDGAALAYTATDGAEDGIQPRDFAEGPRIAVYDRAAAAESVWGGDRPGLMRPVWMTADTLIAIGFVPADDRLSTDIFIVTPRDSQAVPQLWLPSERGEYEEWAAEPNVAAGMLAYESNDGGDREIFVVTEKVGAFDVSNHHEADWNPVWSPDGKWLAFESFRGGRRGVYRVFPETARVYPVEAAPDYDAWHPAWAPDGEWIACVSNRTGAPELYVIHLPTGARIQVTRDGAHNLAPAWRPEIKR